MIPAPTSTAVQRIGAALAAAVAPRRRTVAEIPGLTPRQWQVLCGIHQDKSDKQIAAEMHCSPHTIRAHERLLFQKLGVSSRLGAALVFERHLHRKASPSV